MNDPFCLPCIVFGQYSLEGLQILLATLLVDAFSGMSPSVSSVHDETFASAFLKVSSHECMSDVMATSSASSS